VTIHTAQRSTHRRKALGRALARDLGAAPPIELTWVGSGAWRASDPTVPPDDARFLIAYVVCIDHRVEVTWINSRRPPSYLPTLRDAYTALSGRAE
jgi:hypothetical protein